MISFSSNWELKRGRDHPTQRIWNLDLKDDFFRMRLRIAKRERPPRRPPPITKPLMEAAMQRSRAFQKLFAFSFPEVEQTSSSTNPPRGCFSCLSNSFKAASPPLLLRTAPAPIWHLWRSFLPSTNTDSLPIMRGLMPPASNILLSDTGTILLNSLDVLAISFPISRSLIEESSQGIDVSMIAMDMRSSESPVQLWNAEEICKKYIVEEDVKNYSLHRTTKNISRISVKFSSDEHWILPIYFKLDPIQGELIPEVVGKTKWKNVTDVHWK